MSRVETPLKSPRLQVWKRWLFPPFFSPLGFVQAAAVFVLLGAVAHGLGWRQNTMIISGTLPAGTTGAGWSVTTGVAYALFYFSVVLVVPILLLAAAVFAGCLLWLKRHHTEAGTISCAGTAVAQKPDSDS